MLSLTLYLKQVAILDEHSAQILFIEHLVERNKLPRSSLVVGLLHLALCHGPLAHEEKQFLSLESDPVVN